MAEIENSLHYKTSKMLQPVRGTHDFLPDQMQHYKAVLKVAEEILGRFGFQEMATPIMEASGVFNHVGETSDIVTKETYTFPDRGGDMLTLRPEGTASVMRAVMSNSLTQSLPLKYYYAGPMFRYDRPQKGRYRQFHQLGIELLGISGPEADAEVIAAADMLLKELNIRDDCVLHMNTLGDTESRLSFTEALVTYFSKYRDELSEDSKVRLQKNPLRILDSKAPQDRKLFDGAPKYDDHMSSEARNHFDSVCELLTKLDVAFKVDPLIVRGLDYYAHTTFEFIKEDGGSQGTVLAGGRYDGLCEAMGGPKIPGVGWAAGLERFMDLHKYERPSEISLGLGIMGDEARAKGFELAHALRNKGLTVQLLCGSNPGKLLKKLDKVAVSHAVILGTDELASGRAQVKNMISGVSAEVSLAEITMEQLKGISS